MFFVSFYFNFLIKITFYNLISIKKINILKNNSSNNFIIFFNLFNQIKITLKFFMNFEDHPLL